MSDFVDIVDIKAPKRISLGPPWDVIWGGGMTPGTVTLLGGQPGSGKTTMALQVAGRIAAARRRHTVYLTSEQPLSQLSTLMKRMGLTAASVRTAAIKPKARIEPFIDFGEQQPPAAIVLDTITSVCERSVAETLKTYELLRRVGIDMGGPILIVSHMTRENDFSMARVLQPRVDALVTIDCHKALDGTRLVRVWKNRSGPTCELRLAMTERGLGPYKGKA